MATYLVQTHGFEAINVLEIFKLRLIRQRKAARARKEAKKNRLGNGPSNEEESKEEEVISVDDDHQLEIEDSNLGLESGPKRFCHPYYQPEYKQLRQTIIKETFRDLTGKWNRHFVVFPLSPCDDIQLML